MEVVAATQILIVITVLPEVVHRIGGLRLYGIALSVTAIAGIAAMPIATTVLRRRGVGVVISVGSVLFGAGALTAGLAGRMEVLVLGRFAEGAGTAAIAAVATTGVATLFSEGQRSKVIAMEHLAWAVPSVAGPALGSLAIVTVGWRWAFIVPIPVLAVALVLVVPALGLFVTERGDEERGSGERGSEGRGDKGRGKEGRGNEEGVNGERGDGARGTTRSSLALLGGLLAALTGPVAGGLAGAGVCMAGVLVTAAALARIMPAGTLTMRPGLPAVTLAMFCCTFAFFAVDGFVPLLLTSVDGTGVAAAGIVVTVATAGWTLAGMAQAWMVEHGWTPRRLIRTGAVLLLAGIAGTGLGLDADAWISPYLGWAAGGLGMGLAYSGVWLAVMTHRDLTGPMVAERLGTALGAGVGGVFIAGLTRAGLGIGAGIAAGLVLAVVAAAVLLATTGRLERPGNGFRDGE